MDLKKKKNKKGSSFTVHSEEAGELGGNEGIMVANVCMCLLAVGGDSTKIFR
jgi:hypothetical protein